ncbi:hypothetical protein [Natrarchaeobaculum sulfurireducens]|uniref:Uncharacterized protein n=1 Tax=Natrarchaeobaculum sulfurireducens TaxID=2044521 RepID=A0A346PFY8_9EURY|nr:hypothetical protein [Natrarchaeobaculum sulfurireducens]AXR78433.1 hypothetical protein AArc1_2115 [Natrarchaeobaculum sulfurireducens]AXR81540.1 hypothetical protein AArcMg_1527 [Natrarchaeobaculum sulfurireducens]
MVDSVPTRLERVAAVVAIVALVLLVPAAALGFGITAVVLLFVVVTCGTIARVRVGLDELLTFGVRSIPEDDPAAERYRERRERKDERVREAVSSDYDPRLDRLLVIGLVVVGIGALGAVAVTGGENGAIGPLLVTALVALNAALVAYGAAHLHDRSDSSTDD